MLAEDDLDEVGVAASCVPVPVLEPEGLTEAEPGLGQHRPQRPVAHRAAPGPDAVPARAGVTDPVDLPRSQRRRAGRVLLPHPDDRPLAPLVARDVLQERLVARGAAASDPIQAPSDIDPLSWWYV